MAELDVDHEEEISEESENVCHVCGKVFKYNTSLRRHEKSHENLTCSFPCEECGKTFKMKYLLQSHKNRQHKSQDPNVCPHCGNIFASRPSLSNHIRNSLVGKKITCEVCDKNFKDKYALTRHMKSHNAATSKCPKCSKEFKELEAHIQKCGCTTKSNRYTCDTCGNTFATKAYLRKHLKHKHNPTVMHACECGKSFPYKFSLKRHQKKCGNAQHAQ